MAHAYQAANRLLESWDQVCINTSSVAKQLLMEIFNYLRSSPSSEYMELSKETTCFSTNLIFGGGTEAYSQPC